MSNYCFDIGQDSYFYRIYSLSTRPRYVVECWNGRDSPEKAHLYELWWNHETGFSLNERGCPDGKVLSVGKELIRYINSLKVVETIPAGNNICPEKGKQADDIAVKNRMKDYRKAGFNIKPGDLLTRSGAEKLNHALGTKQERYKNDDGKDTIDKWAERYSIDVFRVIMWCQMEKYRDRLGRKDLPVNEVRKIADYATRWLQVEEEKHEKTKTGL